MHGKTFNYMSVEWGKSIQKNIINTDKSLKRIVILFQIYLYDSILFIILVQWSFSAYISEFVTTYSCIKFLGNYTAAILTLEQNPPERMSSMYIKKYSQESKLRPCNSLLNRPILAGNSRSTGISQLRAGKTRSKRPRSH